MKLVMLLARSNADAAIALAIAALLDRDSSHSSYQFGTSLTTARDCQRCNQLWSPAKTTRLVKKIQRPRGVEVQCVAPSPKRYSTAGPSAAVIASSCASKSGGRGSTAALEVPKVAEDSDRYSLICVNRREPYGFVCGVVTGLPASDSSKATFYVIGRAWNVGWIWTGFAVDCAFIGRFFLPD